MSGKKAPLRGAFALLAAHLLLKDLAARLCAPASLLL